jgi:UDP-2,3-diacylglucosamine pyrophosphatase LpxH
MSTSARLTAVFSSADEIPFDDTSKLILFSDCHRGDNSWADDFAPNQQLLFFALQHYLDAGFTYVEVGDGDELWENRDFAEIRRAHSHIFWLMREFYRDNRLYLMYGNHDIERQDPQIVARTLYQYDDERTRTTQPLFEGIKVHEGLILHHTNTNNRIFLVHGHQADPVSDRWWRFSRFMVRHFWRHLQLLGLHDPTSAAQNYKKRGKIEQRLIQWIETQNQMLIAGHTHRSWFPDEGTPPYYNTGSCVHPRCITGIELQGRDITLIKWSIRPNDEGVLIVARDVLAGPRKMW